MTLRRTLASIVLSGCSTPVADVGGITGVTTGGSGAGSEMGSNDGLATTGAGSEMGSSGANGSGGPKFDIGSINLDVGAIGPTCEVVDDMNAVGECGESAPPNSFTPDVQWSWTSNAEPHSGVTPLVANLTDDNGNGTIDLCDTPDVVVVAAVEIAYEHGVPGHLYVLDGQTGAEHFRIETEVDPCITPAIGDIDDDGLPEIVTTTMSPVGEPNLLLAFEHDGTLKWTGGEWVEPYCGAIALADLDNDGEVEIIAGNIVADHNGSRLWAATQDPGFYSATAAADLDGDGVLEVVLANAAYHADGTPYYFNPDVLTPGYPQIANLDDDPDAEVLVTNGSGVSMLEHNGTTKFLNLRPTGDPAGALEWFRPATVHDFDGDQLAEFASSSANHYTVYEGDASIVWSADVSDLTGAASGTAFDFLGDGIADAMYADETTMFVFDGAGSALLQSPRASQTLIEYPVVADVDNDGSAEIVVVSNYFGDNPPSPTVQVIRDADDRWIQARRIWNQHTYHVTNVREDGTIPQFEPNHVELLNTFRTNAQIEGGGLCKPPPAG